jgi:hypothetical protein
VRPFFSPGFNDEGKNAAPLTLCPLKMGWLESIDYWRIFLDTVTLSLLVPSLSHKLCLRL